MGSLTASKKIGSFDRRITFRESTETQTDTGQVTNSWSDITNGTVFASVKLSGSGVGNSSERFTMEKETTFNRKYFTIRYRTDITEKMIIIYESKEYDIKSIQEVNDTRKRFLAIQAEKRE